MVDAATSRATSDDLRKQIEETNIVAEEPETVTESAGLVEEEVTEEEPKEETTEVETKPKEEPEEKPDLHKIVVEGKEEEVTYEKLKEYAQKGRYLERERAKDKAQRVETQKPPQQEIGDLSKANEKFVEELQKDALGTIVKLMNSGWEYKKAEEKAQRQADRDFESDKRELPHFREAKSAYDELRERGYDRETAWAMAEADYFKEQFLKAAQKGVTEASKKLKLQEKAKIPVGEKKTEQLDLDTLPSLDEIKKLSSKEIGKRLRRVKNEGW